MKYALLGNTGLVVSRLSFGAMTFTAGARPGSTVFKTEAKEAEALVGHALDAGITFFDTANVYSGGQSEEMLGRALASRRDEVVIASKVGMRIGKALVQSGLSRQHILKSVEDSLKRLGTDRIDVLICHREDPYTPLEETLAALDLVVQHGKARYIGFSNWMAWRAAQALEMQKANGWARFTHGQYYYSLVGRDIENDVAPMLAASGLGLTVWSPLAGGFLSGKYTRESLSDPENRMSGWDFLPFDKEAGFALVETMRGIAAAHDASVAQVALAWLLAKPAVTSLLVGASKTAQLDDNVGAVDVALSADEIATLDAAMPPYLPYPAWFAPGIKDDLMIQALA